MNQLLEISTKIDDLVTAYLWSGPPDPDAVLSRIANAARDLIAEANRLYEQSRNPGAPQ